MGLWGLNDKTLKKYPHFDSVISIKEAEALATDPERVAKHTFYPFMLYELRWNRFAEKGEHGESKEREIRYASRADAYIFSRYRHLLSEKYEIFLSASGLTENVLAYRSITDPITSSGKCNIHFARDAFEAVRRIGNCGVIALDISKFFEHLDHDKLYTLWCRLFAVKKLSEDHFQVFKAITKYAVVDKISVYERLGHFGVKRTGKNGIPIRGYLTPYKKMPKQLCIGKEFRKKIAGGNGEKSLIRKNRKPFGVPQGAPMSDLLANLYLLDFDKIVAEQIKKLGGVYFRYSDDILLVVPGGENEAREVMDDVRQLISAYGKKLQIKDKKASIVIYEKNGGDLVFKHIHGVQGRNGFEYLGFRFDGKCAFLRDSTLSNLQRKIVRAARRHSNILSRRFPNKTFSQLQSLFDYEGLIKKFGRVEGFYELHDDVRKWTFWTYVRRASRVLGPLGKPIHRQLRRHRERIRHCANKELERAVGRRERRKSIRP